MKLYLYITCSCSLSSLGPRSDILSVIRLMLAKTCCFKNSPSLNFFSSKVMSFDVTDVLLLLLQTRQQLIHCFGGPRRNQWQHHDPEPDRAHRSNRKVLRGTFTGTLNLPGS